MTERGAEGIRAECMIKGQARRENRESQVRTGEDRGHIIDCRVAQGR